MKNSMLNYLVLFVLVLSITSCGDNKKNAEDPAGYVSQVYEIEAHNLTYLGNYRHWGVKRYSGCWGFTDSNGREYALLGAYDGTSIIDITDAPELKEISFIPGPPSKWREIKVYGNYAYVVNEEGGGMQIIDLNALPSEANVAAVFEGFQTSHNISIDHEKDLLFAEGNEAEPVRVYSLADPLAPQFITAIGLHDNHDIYASHNRVYLSEGHAGTIAIYDSTNPNQLTLLNRFTLPDAGFVHNAWATDDGQYLMTTEENLGKTVKIWDISTVTDPKLIGNYLGPNGYAHNVHIKGSTAYVAHYRSGLRVVDITDPTNPEEKAFMQKNISSSGAWGAFPYFNSGKVIISDIEEGLFVALYRP